MTDDASPITAIVDAHHHLWDLGACRYPWLEARGVVRFFGDPTPIQKNYLVADLRNDASDYELKASVHIQVGVAEGMEVRETEWLEEVANLDGLPSVIVAYCDLSASDAAAVLERQMAFPRVRAIRQIVGRSAEEDAKTGTGGLLRDPTWIRNLGSLAGLGLSFDLQLVPGQAGDMATVLQDMPDLKVAVCHCGSPWDQSEAGLASWRSGMEKLAALPNVYCKLSGLGMFDHQWTAQSIKPIVDSCIAIFGSNRCMFGSNFPVDKLHGSYRKIWQTFDNLTAHMEAEDRANLFADTARSFYRI